MQVASKTEEYVFRPYEWNEADQILFSYSMGFIDTLLFWEVEGLILVLGERFRLTKLAGALEQIGFPTKVEAGTWVMVVEDRRVTPIFAVVIEGLRELMGERETFLYAVEHFIPKYEPQYIRGIVHSNGTWTPQGLEFWVTDERTARELEDKLGIWNVNYNIDEGEMDFPQNVSYPPLECMGVDSVAAWFFYFNRQESEKLFRIIGVSPADLIGR